MPSRLTGMDEILQRLVDEGGEIVPSGQCTRLEIAVAGACRRFYIRDGYGFILRRTREQRAEALAKVAFPTKEAGKCPVPAGPLARPENPVRRGPPEPGAPPCST